MARTSAPPRLIGTIVLSTLALLAAILPATAPPASAAGPPVEFSPASVEFPKTTAGFQSPAEEVTLSSNVGEISVENVYIEGADASQFFVDWGATSCGGSLKSCYMRIVFAPDGPGPKTATVRVPVSAYGSWTFPISGEAVEPQLAIEPSSLDFGVQPVHRGAQRSVQVRNSGEGRVSISGIETAGADRNSFGNDGSRCWELPEGWLDPGATCEVVVYFQPGAVRAFEAALKVRVNEYSVSAPLSGEGGMAVMEPDANPVEFGAATAGGSGELRTITVHNGGNLPGAFFIAIVAGGDAGSFDLLDESCSGVLVEPGSDCQVRIRFMPPGPGPKQARLALFGEDDGGAMIALGGEGVAPDLALTPDGLGFGSVVAGTRGAAQPFAVRNGGPTPVELGGVGIVGAQPDQFLLAGDECTGATLASGRQCLVRVRFAPGSAGAKGATLRIGAPGGPLTAALSGVGTAPASASSATPKQAGKRGAHRGKRKSRAKRRVHRNTTLHFRDARLIKRHAKGKRFAKGKRHGKKRAGKARHNRPARG